MYSNNKDEFVAGFEHLVAQLLSDMDGALLNEGKPPKAVHAEMTKSVNTIAGLLKAIPHGWAQEVMPVWEKVVARIASLDPDAPTN